MGQKILIACHPRFVFLGHLSADSIVEIIEIIWYLYQRPANSHERYVFYDFSFPLPESSGSCLRFAYVVPQALRNPAVVEFCQNLAEAGLASVHRLFSHPSKHTKYLAC